MTQLEFKVLKAWVAVIYDNCRAENKEQLLADNYSWATAQEIHEKDQSITISQISGIFSDFDKKGYINMDHNADKERIWCLDDDFVKKLPNKRFVEIKYEDVISL